MSASFKRTLHRRATKSTVKRVKLNQLSAGLHRVVERTFSDSDSGEDVGGGGDHEGGPELGVCGEAVDGVEGIGVGGAAVHGFEDAGDSDAASEVSGGSNYSVEEEEDTHSEGSHQDVLSDSDDEPIFQSEAEKELYVIGTVREWAQQPGVLSMTKLDDLLHRLAVVFKSMPLTYTTLFQCNYEFDIAELPSGGMLWYKGIRACLNELDLLDYLQKFRKIVLDIGMDGLPLKKAKLWPILGDLVGTDNSPFIIAVFRGSSDPKNVDELLEKYVAELGDLIQNGFSYNGEVYRVVIRNYILDAVARAFIKCIGKHSSYGGCEKCTVVGEYYSNRMTFADLDQPVRTDQSFRLREDDRHHKGVSPLEALGTGMVSQFVLDPMHLVHGGVFKRLLEFWLFNPGPWKLHQEVIDLISSVFNFLRPYCPQDFNRKPCSLSFMKSLKVTQFRRMLLYDGILAFKDLIDDNIYKHFLLLHCGIYILSSKSLIATKRDLAKEFLRLFVSHSVQIYGKQFVVYNVHSMIHLAEECREGLCLDDFSAFKFENKLKSVKETLKSGLHQLQQLARRDDEKKSKLVKISSKASRVALSLKQRGFHGGISGQHFKKLKTKGLLLKVGSSDSCFRTKNGHVIVLKDIVLRNRQIFLMGCKFQSREDFYDYPIPSSDLGICRVSDLGGRRLVFRLADVLSKCYLMPDGDYFLCVPILHSSDFL